MKKVYIKAEYRIPGEVYNSGYICINEEDIKGFFALDKVSIKITKGTLYFYLEEFDAFCYEYSAVQTYKCRINSDTLESPNIYTLRSGDTSLQLKLLEKVSNPKVIQEVTQNFNNLF